MFLGLKALTYVIQQDPTLALQHQMTIIECLDHPDPIIKREVNWYFELCMWNVLIFKHFIVVREIKVLECRCVRMHIHIFFFLTFESILFFLLKFKELFQKVLVSVSTRMVLNYELEELGPITCMDSLILFWSKDCVNRRPEFYCWFLLLVPF